MLASRAWIVVGVLGVATAARADAPLVSVVAKASAGADAPAYAPANAVDDSSTTAWCAHAGASLTLTFDHAIDIDTVELLTGGPVPADDRAVIDALDLATADGRTFRLERTEHRFVHAVGGRATRSLTITIARVHGNAHGHACIRDVLLDRADSLSYELYPGSKRALDAFRSEVAALRRAFDACDAKQLASLVKFPLERIQRNRLARLDVDVVRVGSPSQLAAECRDDKKAWDIGGTLDDDLSSTHFSSERSASVSWSSTWALEWDGNQWWLAAVD